MYRKLQTGFVVSGQEYRKSLALNVGTNLSRTVHYL
jgi:hypothetical protein